MGNSINDTLALIKNIDATTTQFVNEWHNDLPYVIANSSGSTGIPKPIKLTKSDIIKSADATCRYFNINNSSTLVLPLSTNYIAGKMMVVRAIVSGANLWIETPSNRPLNMNYGEIDLLPIVPSQVDWIIENYQYSHNTIRNLLIGGGALSSKKENVLISMGINAFVSYGMTETCSHIALRPIGSNEYETLPGIIVSIDERSCLVIKAPEFSYKEITTNDIVEIIDERHFVWRGRYDNVINTGGIKVFPEEIEKKLSSIIPYPFYVIGDNHEKWGESVTLYIESNNNAIDESKILNDAATLLMKYELPKKIKCVEKFVYTESKKIKRLLL